MTKIALAVAATLMAGQAAAAVTATDVANARAGVNGTVLQEAWLSGASAPTFNIYDGFALGCDAGSISIFTNSATAAKPGSLGDYSAYACVRGGNNNGVVDAGETVAVFYHTVAGGSFNAYTPHLTGTAPDGSAMPALLKRVGAVDTVSCTGTAGLWGSIPVKTSCAIPTGATAADGAPTIPAGGFSDVEAALWSIDVSAAGTEANANVGQVFGVAVSKNLYRELQVAQGIFGTVALAESGDAAYDPSFAPNISSSQYVSIIQQFGGFQTDWSPILGAAGTGKNVHLTRRVATSGTQASSNAFFLKNPCASGPALGQLTPAGLADTSATFIVTEDSGTSGVKTKLTSAATAGNFAIGVVSVENNWRTETATGGRNGYRFVKVDGVHPEAGDTTFARTTAINGQYNFVMEMKSFKANSQAATFGATLIDTISAALGAPANCADVPRGLFLNPAGGSTCTVGLEVAKGTKFGNNCSPVQLFF